jgi:hypothetical protein
MLTMTTPNNRVEATRKTARLTRAVRPLERGMRWDHMTSTESEYCFWQRMAL